MNTPELETQRLILRKFTESDLEALWELLADEEVNRFLPWFPVKSREEAGRFFEERFVASYRKEKAYNYAVCLKNDDRPIGYINVGMDDSHDFGYALDRKFWHKGIMTEAGLAVVEQLKKDRIPYITATHDVNNPKSGAVMRRLGMTYMYSYKEQWQPKDFPVIFRMYQLNFDGEKERVYKKYWDMYEEHFVEDVRI